MDDSGLSGSPLVHAQTASPPDSQSGQTSTGTSTGVVAFDFGSPFEIVSLHIWNLNFRSPYNGRGARFVRIETSMDAGSWTEVEPQVEFPMAIGSDGDPGFPLDAADAPPPADAVPEPGSAVLLALAIAALLRRRPA